MVASVGDPVDHNGWRRCRSTALAAIGSGRREPFLHRLRRLFAGSAANHGAGGSRVQCFHMRALTETGVDTLAALRLAEIGINHEPLRRHGRLFVVVELTYGNLN